MYHWDIPTNAEKISLTIPEVEKLKKRKDLVRMKAA